MRPIDDELPVNASGALIGVTLAPPGRVRDAEGAELATATPPSLAVTASAAAAPALSAELGAQ